MTELAVLPQSSFAPAGPHVAGKVLEGELVVIDLTTGYYFSSPGSGAAIWELAMQGLSLAAAAQEIARATGADAATVESDAVAFAARLRDRGLVLAAAATAQAPVSPCGLSTYAPPDLIAFDDMAETFALDPPLVMGARGPGRT